MANTKIEWAEKTWSPVTGCTPISPGCQNCYAKRMANRLKGRCGYDNNKPFSITIHQNKLNEPCKWHKPRRVFVCSMGDLFHPGVPEYAIGSVLDTIIGVPQHTYLVLTKRPERAISMGLQAHPNLWTGVSCENQEWADKRIPRLLEISAAIRFISLEPLLGPMNLYNASRDYLGPLGRPGAKPVCRGIDWVIIGCESGPGRRPCKLEWMLDIVQQCKAAGVPVFIKQIEVNGKVSHDMSEWPEEVRIREFPKGIS